MTYNLAIGSTYMRSWTSEEENWDSKSNDPAEFPYHPDSLNQDGVNSKELLTGRPASSTEKPRGAA